MKTIAGFIIALFLTCALHAQQTQSWSRVTIYTDDAGLNQLSYAGIPVDHGEYKRGYSFTTDLSSSEIARVDALGFRYEVVIPDVRASSWVWTPAATRFATFLNTERFITFSCMESIEWVLRDECYSFPQISGGHPLFTYIVPRHSLHPPRSSTTHHYIVGSTIHQHIYSISAAWHDRQHYIVGRGLVAARYS